MLELRPVPLTHPDAVALVAAVQRVYVERYGGDDATPVDPAEFAPPRGYFVVGYVDGEPVAAGGFRVRSAGGDRELRDGDAEIKRMYVADAHRCRGFARAVLADLERAAAAVGCRRAVLETGTRQPEAISLYRSAGYSPIPPFGIYREHTGCRCFAKPLGFHRERYPAGGSNGGARLYRATTSGSHDASPNCTLVVSATGRQRSPADGTRTAP